MAVLTFIKQHISSANASSYIFSSTSTGGTNDIGATASDRQVILGAFVVATTSATRTINTADTGGVSAAIVVKTNGTRSTGTMRSFSVGIANALLSTATAISITLTATTTVGGAAITVWTATHVGASAATYGWTFSTTTLGWLTASVATMGVTIGTAGFAVGEAASPAALTWSNMTQEHNTSVDLSIHTGADTTTSAAVGLSATTSILLGGVFAVFTDNSPAAATAEFYRKFTSFPGTVVGRRTLRTMPPLERPEVRI